MQVGVKLFDANNQVVLEKDVAPPELGQAAVVVHKGKYYSYRSIMDNSQWRTAPYARFDECAAPLELN